MLSFTTTPIHTSTITPTKTLTPTPTASSLNFRCYNYWYAVKNNNQWNITQGYYCSDGNSNEYDIYPLNQWTNINNNVLKAIYRTQTNIACTGVSQCSYNNSFIPPNLT